MPKTSDNRSSAAVLVEESWILRMTRPERDQVDELTDSESLARASEGFCPFARHFKPGDQVGTADPVRLVIEPDGRMRCPWDEGWDDGGQIMQFEWLDRSIYMRD